MTDGNGFKTTIEYLSYGASTYSNPLNISQQVTSPTPPTQPSYVTTAINYNLFENISTVTQGGITETRIYDNYQQLCKVRRPDVGVTAYGYYSSGLLNWQANGTTGDTNDCLGVTASDKITYTYNNQNEQMTKSDANGFLQTNTTTLVNNTGIVTQLDNNDTHLTLSYNKRNQLVSKVMDATPFNSISAGDGTTNWTYDNLGYVSTMTYPESGSMLTYANNALGQVTAITENNNGTDYFNISNIYYHPSGGLLGYTLGNGITRAITRTNSGLPQSIVDTKATNTLFSHSYVYDDESNLSSLTDGVDSAYNLSAITYDGLNRLKTLTGNWGASNFNYDNLSNITQMELGSQTLNYIYGATNNRLESTTGSAQFSFQYDSSGNITNNGFRAFDYDKQNRLITSENVSFIHDGEDLIHSKAVVGEPTKYSLYGGNQNILFNFDSDNYGTVYYYLNNESVANVKVTATGRELTYQHNDALGSLAVETNALGTTIKTYHYEPYGFTLEAGQEDSPGFTGQIYDDDLGLNYMKARYYDPMIGRFYSNDTIGFDIYNPMMFNRYAYANNNPYKFIDPNGTRSREASGFWETIFYTGPNKGSSVSLRETSSPLPADYLTSDGNFQNLTMDADGYFYPSKFGQEGQQYYYDPSNNLMIANRDRGAVEPVIISDLFLGGSFTGIRGIYKYGKEFPQGSKTFRIAPFGNRKGGGIGKYPHYHRAKFNAKGDVIRNQGIKRHRPWERRDTDKIWRDRF